MQSGYQSPIKIIDVISKIEQEKIIIPAIQREFVWSAKKIENLFDSIMQGYPINSFLMWEINQNNKDYKYYKILHEYREKFKTFGEPVENPKDKSLIVLDGQQRLTSFYIGLKGTYGFKTYNKNWKDNNNSIPNRKLYLNLNTSSQDDDNDDDLKKYNFKFLTDNEFNNNFKEWFLVADILKMDSYDIIEYHSEHTLTKFQSKLISILHDKVFNQSIINYYLETTPSYTTALQIFLRTNRSGTFLSYADLVMSTIILAWETKGDSDLSAKEEFKNLYEYISNNYNYTISNDLIIRSYLMCKQKNVNFDVDNFTTTVAEDFKNEWNNIKKVIILAIQLVKSFGCNNEILTAKNALLPIIQYLFLIKADDNFISHTNFKDNRLEIRKWLNASLLVGVFGGQSNQYLQKIKNIIDEQLNENENALFPYEIIKEKTKTTRYDINLTESYLKEVLYSNSNKNKLILYLIHYASEGLSCTVNISELHIDHIVPKSWFNKLEENGINIDALSEEDKQYYLDEKYYNSIVNFQFLTPNENSSKNDKSLKEWIDNNKVNCENRLIPNEYLDFKDFPKFIQTREEKFLTKLKKSIGLSI